MNILYIAKHNSGGNDDEGAIAHALGQLGHGVEKVGEAEGSRTLDRRCAAGGFDFALWHKWSDWPAMSRLPVPKVFWHFDLVDFPDPSLEARCRSRREWMARATELVDLGFCTDGDWVARDRTGKLRWLQQGADERVVGLGRAVDSCWHGDLLFAGIAAGGGKGRISFVDWALETFGRKLHHVSAGVHGRAMAGLVKTSSIVLAPDSPVGDRYCSNRVWNALGFGAFMLHPATGALDGMLEDGKDLVLYRNRDDLACKVEHYLGHPEERRRIAAHGLETVKGRHLYRHRCIQLIEEVKKALGK